MIRSWVLGNEAHENRNGVLTTCVVSKRWSINGKEFDTYKVGAVANSCSTMHKIAAKEFTLEDFSTEHLFGDKDMLKWDERTDIAKDHALAAVNVNGDWCYFSPRGYIQMTCNMLNRFRQLYLETKDKNYWWQMIQLLPSSYNQKRTVMLNYEVLANMYKSRKGHRLDEWRTMLDWIESLPYSELITGKSESEEILKIGEALYKGMEKGLVDAWTKVNLISQKEVDKLTEDWNELVDKAWKEAFPNDLEDDSSDTHDFLKKELNIERDAEE